jgi:hypothetical protein
MVSVTLFTLAFAFYNTLQPIQIYYTFLITAFGALTVASVTYASVELNTVISNNFTYVRELLADAYSAIHTRNPDCIKSALIKNLFPNNYQELNNHKNPEIKPLPKMSKIFETRLGWEAFLTLALSRKRSVQVNDSLVRLQLPTKLNQIIFHNIEIQVLKPTSRYWFFSNMPNIESEMQLPAIVADIYTKNKYLAFKLQRYIQDHLSFNLLDCSKYLETDPFELFSLLVALVELRVIDF